MKCSECGGQVISMEYGVYRTDGSSSGEYHCQKCGKTKPWFIQGPGEPTIYMGDRDNANLCSSNLKKESKDGNNN